MTSGCVLRPKFIARSDVRSRPDARFVFGDNMERRGFRGQAKEMRGEPNAVGVPTKWKPDRAPASYFSDSDFDKVRVAIDSAFRLLRDACNGGADIVIPADGIGTGLADLPNRAPRIHRYIEKHIAALEAASAKAHEPEER
jgi:hypothetical protein